MNRRAFLLSALTTLAALCAVKFGVQAEGEPLQGQMPMGVPYTIAADPPKQYLFIPQVNR
jgi:hypothetical protein